MSLQELRADIPEFLNEGVAACSEVDPEIFFPHEEELPSGKIVAVYRYQKQATEICRQCPLMVKCLEYSLRNAEYGIWGGMTENQRRGLRQRSRIKLSSKW
jgi:WhiB family redox-sensing transcriptional regulator